MIDEEREIIADQIIYFIEAMLKQIPKRDRGKVLTKVEEWIVTKDQST